MSSVNGIVKFLLLVVHLITVLPSTPVYAKLQCSNTDLIRTQTSDDDHPLEDVEFLLVFAGKGSSVRNRILVDALPSIAQRLERHPDSVEDLNVVQSTEFVPGRQGKPAGRRVGVWIVEADAAGEQEAPLVVLYIAEVFENVDAEYEGEEQLVFLKQRSLRTKLHRTLN